MPTTSKLLDNVVGLLLVREKVILVAEPPLETEAVAAVLPVRVQVQVAVSVQVIVTETVPGPPFSSRGTAVPAVDPPSGEKDGAGGGADPDPNTKPPDIVTFPNVAILLSFIHLYLLPLVEGACFLFFRSLY